MSFGMNLKKLRKAKGLTQAEVAQEMGVTQSAYAHYENSIRKLEADKIPLLAKVLGVQLVELYGGEAAKGKETASKIHRNKRTAKIQELFDKLPAAEQRIVLKQIRLMSES